MIIKEFNRAKSSASLFGLFFASLFVGCFFVANSAKAGSTVNTYYVDKDSIGGTCNDTYNTTQAQVITTPWCTIGKAATTMVAGDTVNIRTGTYYETIAPANSGSEGNPITFQGKAGETVTVSGGKLETGFASCTTGECSGMTHVYRTAEAVLNSILNVWESDTKIWYTSVASVALVDSTDDSFYLDAAGDKLYIHTSDHTIATHTIEAQTSTNSTIFSSTNNYITFKNLSFRSAARPLDRSSGDGLVIDGCTLYNSGKHGIRVTGGSNYLIKNSIISDTGIAGFSLYNATNVSIYNNLFYNNGYNGALFFLGSITTISIYNNIFYNNNSMQELYNYVPTGTSGMDVKNNLFYINDSATPFYTDGAFTLDPSNIVGDPQFINASTGNFHLTSNSPAIDAGKDLSSDLTVDKDNLARPSGQAFDIGPYEYQDAVARLLITTDGGNGAGEDFATTADSVLLSGTVSSSTHTIKVNGATLGGYVAGSTSWSYDAPIASGTNTFSFIAYNSSDDASASTTINIIKNRPYVFVAVGDSITSGQFNSWRSYATNLTGNGLGTLLSTYYTGHSTTTTTSAYSGEYSANGLLRISKTMIDNSPSIVLIQYGSNDNRDGATTGVINNLRNIVRIVKSLGATPILSIINPPSSALLPLEYASMPTINNLIRAMALEEDVTVTDNWTTWTEHTGWATEYLVDMYHPNDAGNAVIARNFFNSIVYGRKLHTNRNRVSTNYSMEFDDTATYPIEASSTDLVPITVYADSYSQESAQIRTVNSANISLNFTDLKANHYYDISVGGVQNNTGCDNNCKTDSDGVLTYTHTGVAADHTFNITEGDNTAPTITIIPPNNDLAQSKTITASVSDGTLNQKITTGSICDGTLSGFTSYADTTFTSESDNGKKICYKAWDTNENTSYELSEAIAGIDTTPPTISNLTLDNSILPVTTTSATLSISTNETAICRYATTTGIDYASMTAFTNTNATDHNSLITGLTSGTTYNYYFKCKDLALNETGESSLSFSVAPVSSSATTLEKIEIKISQTINKFKDTLHIAKNKFKLKQTDSNLTNGTVKIYKGNSLWKTITIDAQGAWSQILKLKDDFSGWLKIKQYDQYGTLLSTSKAKVKIDTEKPIFTKFITAFHTVSKGQRLSFEATDNQKIDKYKIYFNGRTYTSDNAYFDIPDNTPNGTYSIRVKAYDQAGNTATQQTWVRVIN